MSILKKIILLALVLAVSTSAQALMSEYTVDKMAESSESVVKGRVIDLKSRWLDGADSIIVTDVEFIVDEVWGGQFSTNQKLTFYVVGGVVDGLGMRQEHQPVFTKGEEAVLFLWTQPDQRRLAIFNDEQGRYKVVGDKVINFKQQALSLQDFREEVKRSVQPQRR
jgi:hypothetical protein